MIHFLTIDGPLVAEFCGPNSDGPEVEWIDTWVYRSHCGWTCTGCGCCVARGMIYREDGMFFWDDFSIQHPPRAWLGEAMTWEDAKRIVRKILQGSAA